MRHAVTETVVAWMAACCAAVGFAAAPRAGAVSHPPPELLVVSEDAPWTAAIAAPAAAKLGRLRRLPPVIAVANRPTTRPNGWLMRRCRVIPWFSRQPT